jgi:hypothetical protein
MSQTKVLEMGKVAKNLAQELKSDYMTADKMMDILVPICAETSVMKQWVQKLDDIQAFGIRRIRKERAMTAETYGLDSEEIDKCVDATNDKEPWLVPPIRRAFTSTCRVQFNQMLTGLDPLTRIGAMRYFMPEDTGSDSWDMYNPAIWTSWHGRGTKATLRGPIKFGKTNFALYLDEQFLKQGIDVKSNIAVKNAPKGYGYCATVSQLLRSICESRLAEREVNITFDEANLFWAKVDTIRPKNIDLGKLALCFGKMHASLLFISHYQSIIPTVVVQTAVAEFEKLSIKSVWAEIRQGIKMSSRVVSPVPATRLEYDPDQLQWFSLDMDVERLFNFMGGIDPAKNQWKEILTYIDRHKGEMEDSDIEPKAIAQWLRRHGRSTPDIADILKKPKSTIIDWCRGIK